MSSKVQILDKFFLEKEEIENKIFEIEEKIEICNKDIQNPEIFNDKDKFLQIGEDLSRLIKELEIKEI